MTRGPRVPRWRRPGPDLLRRPGSERRDERASLRRSPLRTDNQLTRAPVRAAPGSAGPHHTGAVAARVAFVFTLLFPLTWLVIIGFLAGNEVVDERSGVRVMQFVTPTAAAMGVLYATLPTVATIVGLVREHGLLKRVPGILLPACVYLAGRIGGAVVLAFGWG